MILEAVRKVTEGISLTMEEAEAAMREIMAGGVTDAQIAGYIAALKTKGETAAEVAGSARAMRALATPVPTRHLSLVDTCGTGGDGSGSFNISTAAALVVAAAGQPVAKHGNRSVSSRSGSADVLEALGIELDLEPEEVGRCIDEVGIGFLYAPRLHAAMKYAARPRKELGIRTIFNLLGPLANPAGAQVQLLGVCHPSLVELVARVLVLLGTRRALVVHGEGFDELTTTGTNLVAEVNGGEIRTFPLRARELGLPLARPEELAGGTPHDNAEIIMGILRGEKGARREVVLLNAGAALCLSGRARDLAAGINLAAQAIDSGRALAKLEAWKRFAKREEA